MDLVEDLVLFRDDEHAFDVFELFFGWGDVMGSTSTETSVSDLEKTYFSTLRSR